MFVVSSMSDVTCVPTVESDNRGNDTVDVLCGVISEDTQVRYANVAFEVEETFTCIVNLNMSDFCPFEPTAWKYNDEIKLDILINNYWVTFAKHNLLHWYRAPKRTE